MSVELDLWKSYVEDAHRLVKDFAVDISDVRPCQHGTARYREVCDAYEQLAKCQRELHGKKEWGRRLPNGKNADDLMNQLWELRKDLQKIGEGMPTGESRLRSVQP